jgi:hypothetical protein
MKPYEPRTPRIAFAIAAVALSVMTMGVMVAAPTAVQSDATLFARPAIEVDITPARIDVIAMREPMITVSQAVSPHVDR